MNKNEIKFAYTKQAIVAIKNNLFSIVEVGFKSQLFHCEVIIVNSMIKAKWITYLLNYERGYLSGESSFSKAAQP